MVSSNPLLRHTATRLSARFFLSVGPPLSALQTACTKASAHFSLLLQSSSLRSSHRQRQEGYSDQGSLPCFAVLPPSRPGTVQQQAQSISERYETRTGPLKSQLTPVVLILQSKPAPASLSALSLPPPLSHSSSSKPNPVTTNLISSPSPTLPAVTSPRPPQLALVYPSSALALSVSVEDWEEGWATAMMMLRGIVKMRVVQVGSVRVKIARVIVGARVNRKRTSRGRTTRTYRHH
jgi:hypothetical protein